MAGGAEKIRQYFVQGFYPLGKAASGAAFLPEAALVRAVILASCSPVAGIGGIWKSSIQANYPFSKGFYRYAIPAESGPNFIEGFGLPVLDRAVYMSGSSKEHNMIYMNATFTPTSNTSFAFNISCLSGFSTRISLVLVWTDPAGSVTSSKQLVNDLDLIVIANDIHYFGNMRPYADQMNTVERVVLSTCPTGRSFTAIVTLGLPLKSASQTWYLVSNGPVSHVSATDSPPLRDRGRVVEPLTQLEPCTFAAGVFVTVKFKPASAWTCQWNCNAEAAAFTALLSQLVGVAGQGIRVASKDESGVALLLRCSALINSWNSDAVSLKYVTAESLLTAIRSICQRPSSLCSNDDTLGVFDWASLAVISVPAATTSISMTSYTGRNCSNFSSTFLETPNPFVFTDQSCFPGSFVSEPSRYQRFYKAVSCNHANVSFSIHSDDPTCSNRSGILVLFSADKCVVSDVFGRDTSASFTCASISRSAPGSSTSVDASLSLFTIIVISVALAIHMVQFIAWVLLSHRARLFTYSSALILLLLPGVGLVAWRSICFHKRKDAPVTKALLPVNITQ
jgi:hypothetical protein